MSRFERIIVFNHYLEAVLVLMPAEPDMPKGVITIILIPSQVNIKNVVLSAHIRVLRGLIP